MASADPGRRPGPSRCGSASAPCQPYLQIETVPAGYLFRCLISRLSTGVAFALLTAYATAASGSVWTMVLREARQRLTLLVHVGPGVGPPSQPIPDRSDGDTVGAQVAFFNGGPRDRHGDRCATLCPDRIGCDHRLGVGV